MSPCPVCIRRSPSDHVVPFLCKTTIQLSSFEKHRPCKTTQTYPWESLAGRVCSPRPPSRKRPALPLRRIPSLSTSAEPGPRILQTSAPRLSCSQTAWSVQNGVSVVAYLCDVIILKMSLEALENIEDTSKVDNISEMPYSLRKSPLAKSTAPTIGRLREIT